MSKIIYPSEGGVAVIHSTGDLPIEQIALKDVPAGVPFLIIDESNVPEDRTFRDAWIADFSNPHGHGIGHDAWAAMQPQPEQQKIIDVDHD